MVDDNKDNLEAELQFVGNWKAIEETVNNVEEHGLYLNGKNIGVAEVQTTNHDIEEEVTFAKN